MGDDLEMDGVAADDTTERDHPVIVPARALCRVERNGDRSRNFEGARHADAVDFGPRFLKHLHCAGKERTGDVVIIARLDDEDARTVGVALLTLASPRSGHSLHSIAVGW